MTLLIAAYLIGSVATLPSLFRLAIDDRVGEWDIEPEDLVYAALMALVCSLGWPFFLLWRLTHPALVRLAATYNEQKRSR